MPIFKITAISTRIGCGQRLDKGLSVELQTYSYANPITSYPDQVAQAFLYQRNVDLKKLGALNTSCLKATRIG